jgi:LysM repeat protein
MKRFLLMCALAGALPFAASAAAAAAPVGPGRSLPAIGDVAQASGSPPRAILVVKVQTPTPLPRVTVMAGDTLWGIGIRTHRTWAQLAGYNHVANPNLIYVGDVEVIPPANYVPGPVVIPQATVSTPPAHHYTAPTRTYTPVQAPVVRRSYVAPQSYGAPGSFQACVATRESGNGSGSSNIYGILNSTWASLGRSGSAWGASRAEQDAAFAQLYARDGRQPWAPYDGC